MVTRSGPAVRAKPSEDLYRGYCPRDTRWSREFDEWKSHNPNGQPFDFDQDGIRTMENLLALCQKEGITMIMVFAPVYHGLNPLVSNRSQIFAEFQALSQRYNSPFWDYSQAPITEETEYFANAQHLTWSARRSFPVN